MLDQKDKTWLKIISVALVVTFLIYDIAWAIDFLPAQRKEYASNRASRSIFKNKTVDYDALKAKNESNLSNIKDTLVHKNGSADTNNASNKKDLSNLVKASYINDIANIYINDNLGKVIDSYSAPDSKGTVIHIQDLHTNPEASINLAGILEILLKDYNLGLVCSEGSSGKVDTSSVSSFPDSSIREKVARIFVNSGELTGEEYLSITKYPNLSIWGIEDRGLYFQHIIEFNKIAKFSPNALIFTNQVKAALSKLKPEIYSKALLDLDSKEAEYQESKLDTTKYLDYLLGLAKDIDLANYKNISIFKETLEAEKTIDQSRIIKESQNILSDVQAILKDKDNKSEIKNLSIKSSLFKDKKISPFSFYSYLDELARRHLKEGLDKHLDFLNFVAYLRKINSLDSIKLFNEIEELTYETKDLISDNDNQKLLSKSIRNIKFLENFFNLKISNEELEYYLKNKDSFSVELFKEFLQENLERYSMEAFIDFNPDLIDKNLSELESFYAIAHKRDLAMFDNASSEIEKYKTKTIALIAGGFHTRGITNILKEQGYSYVVIAPYSKTGIDEENYKDLLSGKRKDLSELLVSLNNTLRLMMGFSNQGFISGFNGEVLPVLKALGIPMLEPQPLSDRFIVALATARIIAALAAQGLKVDHDSIEAMFTEEFRAHLEEGIVIKEDNAGNVYIGYKGQYVVAKKDGSGYKWSNAETLSGFQVAEAVAPVLRRRKALVAESEAKILNVLQRLEAGKPSGSGFQVAEAVAPVLLAQADAKRTEIVISRFDLEALERRRKNLVAKSEAKILSALEELRSGKPSEALRAKVSPSTKDGFIRKGDAAFRIMVANLSEGNFTDEIPFLQEDIQEVAKAAEKSLQDIAGSDQELRIIVTDAIVINVKDDYCLGFYSHGEEARQELIDLLGSGDQEAGEKAFNKLFPKPTLVLSRQIRNNPNPSIRQEELYHEARCSIAGHYQAIEDAKLLFPENYSDINLNPQGSLQRALRNTITEAALDISESEILRILDGLTATSDIEAVTRDLRDKMESLLELVENNILADLNKRQIDDIARLDGEQKDSSGRLRATEEAEAAHKNQREVLIRKINAIPYRESEASEKAALIQQVEEQFSIMESELAEATALARKAYEEAVVRHDLSVTTAASDTEKAVKVLTDRVAEIQQAVDAKLDKVTAIARHLATAKGYIASKNYTGAQTELASLLDLEPNYAEALELQTEVARLIQVAEGEAGVRRKLREISELRKAKAAPQETAQTAPTSAFSAAKTDADVDAALRAASAALEAAKSDSSELVLAQTNATARKAALEAEAKKATDIKTAQETFNVALATARNEAEVDAAVAELNIIIGAQTDALLADAASRKSALIAEAKKAADIKTATIESVYNISEPLSEKSTQEIFTEWEQLLTGPLNEEKLSYALDFAYRIYRGYPFNATLLLRDRKQYEWAYKTVAQLLDRTFNNLMSSMDAIESRDRKKVSMTTQKLIDYDRYFIECLGGYRHIITCAVLANYFIPRYIITEKNKFFSIPMRLWNVFAMSAESVIRTLWGMNGGVQRAKTILSRHVFNIFKTGNDLSVRIKATDSLMYPTIKAGTSSKEVLKKFNFDVTSLRAPIDMQSEASIESWWKNRSMIAGRLVALVNWTIAIATIALVVSNYLNQPMDIYSALKALGTGMALSVLPSQFAISRAIALDNNKYRKALLKKLAKVEKKLHEKMRQLWDVTIPEDYTQQILAEEAIATADALRNEPKERSADFILVVTDSEYAKDWEQKVKDTLVRPDAPFKVITSNKGSGMALLEAYAYLGSDEFRKTCALGDGETFKDRRIIILLGGDPKCQAAAMRNYKWQLAVGCKSTQELKKKNINGRVVINLDGVWAGPVRINGDITLCTYLETGEMMSSRGLLLVNAKRKVVRAFKKISINAAEPRLQNGKGASANEVYDFNNLNLREWRAAAGVWIESIENMDKFEKLVKLFGEIRTYAQEEGLSLNFAWDIWIPLMRLGLQEDLFSLNTARTNAIVAENLFFPGDQEKIRRILLNIYALYYKDDPKVSTQASLSNPYEAMWGTGDLDASLSELSYRVEHSFSLETEESDMSHRAKEPDSWFFRKLNNFSLPGRSRSSL